MAAATKLPPSILKLDSTPFRTPVLPFAACRIRYDECDSPHVHFPPTPGLAVTYPADSPATYDRKPIVISPNVVQLPSRGSRKLCSPPADFDRLGCARGRPRSRWVEDLDIKGSYFHPRAYEACSTEPLIDRLVKFEPTLPPLVQDLSPSDESDDITTPPHATQPMSQSNSQLINLHLPNFSPKARRLEDEEPTEIVLEAEGDKRAGRSPPLKLTLASLPPPPRTLLKRVAQRLAGNESSLSSSLSPCQDEGCLGGF